MKWLVVNENFQRFLDRDFVARKDPLFPVIFDDGNIRGIQSGLSFEMFPVNVLQGFFNFLPKVLVMLDEFPGVLGNL
ncbi:MAG: hypothetical protein A4E62_01462 [Syntrophorhabdus sp. PtaU1.Bin002]|nr:MAG: hypothetical protein A4E62_01462 [Syntrophorhabdus sp. PtaU1.Bin002]